MRLYANQVSLTYKSLAIKNHFRDEHWSMKSRGPAGSKLRASFFAPESRSRVGDGARGGPLVRVEGFLSPERFGRLQALRFTKRIK
jgi:hypothetical protein